MGGFLSHAEGFTDLIAMWPAYAFHALCTALGTALISRGAGARRAQEQQTIRQARA
ncbi:MAG: hypothetical protein ACYC4L_13890 [Chloroflexota bacterium]